MICALSSGERVDAFGFPLNSLWKACMALAVTSCRQKHSSHIKIYTWAPVKVSKGYLTAPIKVFVPSPHGWVSSLAAESRSRTWQLPEETSPSTPLGGPAHEVWWCPLCSLGGTNKHTTIIFITVRTMNRHMPAVCMSEACQWVCRLTSGLLHFFDAELGCGHSSRVMGWCIIFKQEVTTSENGANPLLRCFTDLTDKSGNKLKKMHDFSISFNIKSTCNAAVAVTGRLVRQTLGLLCTVKLRRPW